MYFNLKCLNCILKLRSLVIGKNPSSWPMAGPSTKKKRGSWALVKGHSLVSERTKREKH